MGTRNLFTIVYNNELKLAKYNQWDGYLDGQGKDLAEFIVNDLDFEKLISGLNKVQLINEGQYDEKMKSIACIILLPSLITENFPLLSRDCGIKGALQVIQDATYTIEKSEFSKKTSKFIRSKKTVKIPEANLVSISSLDFKNDGLFCEYAYELNLDDYTISVYKSGAKKCNKLILKTDILSFPELLDIQIKLQNEDN